MRSPAGSTGFSRLTRHISVVPIRPPRLRAHTIIGLSRSASARVAAPNRRYVNRVVSPVIQAGAWVALLPLSPTPSDTGEEKPYHECLSEREDYVPLLDDAQNGHDAVQYEQIEPGHIEGDGHYPLGQAIGHHISNVAFL